MGRGEAETTRWLGSNNRASSGVGVPHILPDFLFPSLIHPSNLHVFSPYFMQNTVLIMSEKKLLEMESL